MAKDLCKHCINQHRGHNSLRRGHNRLQKDAKANVAPFEAQMLSMTINIKSAIAHVLASIVNAEDESVYAVPK